MSPVFSHSRLETFGNCPKKYKFRYIDKIKTDKKSIEAFMGGCVHDVLEKLYQDVGHAHRPALEDLLKYYNLNWEREWNDQITIVREEYNADDYREVGRQCLEKYYERYYPFDQEQTVGIEERINIVIRNNSQETYRLCGFIDRLVATQPDGYEIHDYKTSSGLPSQEKLDQDRQLALYHLGIKQRWPTVKKVELVWHYLKHDRELRSSRTDEQLKQLEKHVIHSIKKIEQEREFPTVVGPLCSWCEYKDICPAWSHELTVEALPADKYLEDQGVQLVNAYARLSAHQSRIKEKLAQIESEMGRVKEAVVQWVQKENVTRIEGSDHFLKVAPREDYEMPNKKTSPQAHTQLTEMIRRSPYWEEVSAMSPMTLKKLLREKRWDEKFLEKVFKFVKRITKWEVTLSSKGEEG